MKRHSASSRNAGFLMDPASWRSCTTCGTRSWALANRGVDNASLTRLPLPSLVVLTDLQAGTEHRPVKAKAVPAGSAVCPPLTQVVASSREAHDKDLRYQLRNELDRVQELSSVIASIECADPLSDRIANHLEPVDGLGGVVHEQDIGRPERARLHDAAHALGGGVVIDEFRLASEVAGLRKIADCVTVAS